MSFKKYKVQQLFHWGDKRRILWANIESRGKEERGKEFLGRSNSMSKSFMVENIVLVQGSDEGVFDIWEMLIGADCPRILQCASVKAFFFLPVFLKMRSTDLFYKIYVFYFRLFWQQQKIISHSHYIYILGQL